MQMEESDWKIFRRLDRVALERYCQRVLEEVRLAAEGGGAYHDRYLKVYRLIEKRDKRMSVIFDDPRRSNALILLSNMIEEGLLTEEELKQFSQETQARLQLIENLRRS